MASGYGNLSIIFDVATHVTYVDIEDSSGWVYDGIRMETWDIYSRSIILD